MAFPSRCRSWRSAVKLSKKAARVGYDFPDRSMLFDKLREEVAELAGELFPGGANSASSGERRGGDCSRCAYR